MKRTLTAILALLLLTACSRSRTIQVDTSQPPYSMIPGTKLTSTVAGRKNEVEIFAPVTVEGRSRVPRRYGAYTEFVAVVDGWVRVLQKATPDTVGKVVPTDEPRVPAKLSVGTSWTTAAGVTYTVEAVEPVTVRAGTFATAYRTRVEGVTPRPDDPPGPLMVWFVPGYGGVLLKKGDAIDTELIAVSQGAPRDLPEK